MVDINLNNLKSKMNNIHKTRQNKKLLSYNRTPVPVYEILWLNCFSAGLKLETSDRLGDCTK